MEIKESLTAGLPPQIKCHKNNITSTFLLTHHLNKTKDKIKIPSWSFLETKPECLGQDQSESSEIWISIFDVS